MSRSSIAAIANPKSKNAGASAPAFFNSRFRAKEFANQMIEKSCIMFNLMRKMTFKSRAVNYIASLSMLIYIIHENIVLRTYFRPAIWNRIYHEYGYSSILLWVFVLAFGVLMFGLVSSVLYDKIARKTVKKAANALYEVVRRTYLKIEERMRKIR